MPFSKGRSTPQNAFLETLAQKFKGNVSNFILGNAQADRNYQIVYCSDGFCQLTGFSRTELMQQSCSCGFLTGRDTAAECCLKINAALSSKSELTCEIQLYKKSGAPFWCLLDILPIRNETGSVVLFLVSHKDITQAKVSGFGTEIRPERENNNRISTSAPKLRKFSRDVLFHIQRQYQSKNCHLDDRQCQPQRNCPSAKLGGNLPSYPTHYANNAAKTRSRFVIMHFGRFRFVWDWMVLLLVLYVAIITPYHAAFENGIPAVIYFRVFDFVVDMIFLGDIILNFRTTYIDKKSGQLVTDLRLIAKYYVTHWFAVDFLAAIPYEILLLINSSWQQTVHVLKLSRLLRISRAARRFGRYTENTVILLLLLMLSFSLLGHWLSCIWYVIGCRGLQLNHVEGWLQAFGDQINKPYVNRSLATGPSRRDTYVSSLYFVLTSLTTVGFGNIAPNTLEEKIFSIVVLLIGALVQSAIFGNMTAVIHKLYAERAKFQSKSAEIKQFVHINRIEGDLQKRIEDYFLTSWSVSKGVDREEIMASFPIELRADICMKLYSNFLNLPMFRDMNLGLLRSLSLKIKHAQFTPGETILKEKDAVTLFYFVQEGTIEVVQKESIVAILGSGDTFGEEIFRRQHQIGRSNGDVKALTYCSLLYLTRESVAPVLVSYPEILEWNSTKHDMIFNLTKEMHNRPSQLHSIDEGEEDERCWDPIEDTTYLPISKTRRSTRSSVTSNSSAVSSSEMPLWQRQLRNEDTQEISNYGLESLESRLRQIEDDSASEDDRIMGLNHRITNTLDSPVLFKSKSISESLISNSEYHIDTINLGQGTLRNRESRDELTDSEDDSCTEADCLASGQSLLQERLTEETSRGRVRTSKCDLDWDPSTVDFNCGTFSLPDMPSLPPVLPREFNDELLRSCADGYDDKLRNDDYTKNNSYKKIIEDTSSSGNTSPNSDLFKEDMNPTLTFSYHSLPGRRRQVKPIFNSNGIHSSSLPLTMKITGNNADKSNSIIFDCDCEQDEAKFPKNLTKCQQRATHIVESTIGPLLDELTNLKRDIQELKSAIMTALPKK